jgi:long-subunit acyl-CoA synthetase (AMP-forming)
LTIYESGCVVERGIPGELMARGYCTFLGYWNNPEKTAEIFVGNKWLRTGDLVVMHESGLVPPLFLFSLSKITNMGVYSLHGCFVI